MTSSSDPAARVDEVELADTAASLATTVDVPPSGGVCGAAALAGRARRRGGAPSPPLTAPGGGGGGVEHRAGVDEDLATELDEPLGQGTYGVVYRGVARGHVAVKILSLSVETPRRCRPRSGILRACACDHIVGYISARRALDGRQALWIVMELAEHGSTHDLMKRRGGALDEATVAWVCAGVLRALHHMHTVVRAIHRDVKAANVLVVRGGAIKLADLGVAAQLQRTLSKRGTMIGTPWLAPEALAPGLEQPAAGDGGDGGGGDVGADAAAADAATAATAAAQYDARVDIWSLGITAIELEGSRREVRFLFQVMMKIVTGEPPPSRRAPASAAFRAFLAAALVKDPAARPPPSGSSSTPSWPARRPTPSSLLDELASRAGGGGGGGGGGPRLTTTVRALRLAMQPVPTRTPRRSWAARSC